MKNKSKHIIVQFLILLFLFPLLSAQNINEVIELNTWEVSKAYRENWFTAKTPATIHPLLYEKKRMADPYRGSIEDRLQFIGNSDWTYRKTLNITKQQLEASEILLQFEGLDTYTAIYINKKKLFTTDNMFRTFEFDIKPHLKEGDNVLEIYFLAPLVFTKNKNDSLNINFPGGERVWTRKAQFQFGWDWAPTYITMGIWKPVNLKFMYKPYVKNFDVNYELNDKWAIVKVSAEVYSHKNSTYQAEIKLGEETQTKTMDLKKGLNHLSFELTIKKPKLWWPNGMGSPTLYDLSFKGGEKENQPELFHRKIGFRKTELVTIPDQKGETFYFRINGKPMFAKGANYVPADAFPEQVTNEKLFNLLTDAQKSNFNMLRVWGGGIYESERFYGLCDSLGLMIWQDFMFACAMYPGEESFLKNIELEAEENIKRISQHPCIALWCGNNENAEGWARWGWQDVFIPDKKKYLEKAYYDLFNDILPKSVAKWGKDVPYWESSPKFGRGDIRHRFEGDAHYWGVWHDAEDFSMYEEKVPRFMSEFGFQSYPEINTIRYFSGMDLDQNEESILAHQKHPRGNMLISNYIERDFEPAKDFESFVYLSQVIQAEGISRGIVAHRTAMPYCMGSLYWQFNDCWPAISWSSIDYFGRWKPLQYGTKSLFAPVLLSSKEVHGKLVTTVVSEKENPLTAKLQISVYTLDGKIVEQSEQKIELKPNTSQVYHTKELTDLQNKYGTPNLCYVSTLKDQQNRIISQDFDFSEKPKDLKLLKNKLSLSVKEVREGYLLTINSDAINPGVWITTDLSGSFSDNYFSMIPGTKEVLFSTFEPAKDISKAFKVFTWQDAAE